MLQELDTAISMATPGSDFHDLLVALRERFIKLEYANGVMRVALNRIARSTSSDDPCRHLVEVARMVLSLTKDI